MYYEDNRVKDLKVAYIGGGSRGWAWGFMMDLAADAQMEGTVALYDIDHEAAEHNEIIGNKISAHPDAVSHWKYTVADTLQQALTGADFVVISILPGTFDEMESDVHAPEAYGIYQSVGDTVGAGGFMRAMRTIPMYVTIAEAIRDYSPNAWVINYTNPMTLCVRTLYHVFPKIKAFGCCHEVFGTQTLLTHILDEELGLKDVARQDIKVNVKGINHFTWFDKATYKGMDLFPIYRKFAEEHYESGYEYGDTNWMNSSFACANRVKFDLFLRYGCIAAAGDRHLAEFMPGKTYLESPEAVREWKFGLTTVAWRKNELQERLARSRRQARWRGRPPADESPARPGRPGQQREHSQPRCHCQPAVGCRGGSERAVQPPGRAVRERRPAARQYSAAGSPPRLQSGEHPDRCPDLRPHPWPDHLYERPAGDPELEPRQRAV